MNYVIYGAGHRGKELFNYIIRTNNILAFIDLDVEKQQKQYCGKPVISLQEYITTYASCYIIITPAYSNNIEDILEEHNIYQYSNLMDMPLEFAGYGDCKFENCYEGLKHSYSEPFCLYGINAFSFFLYDYLRNDKKISICPENGCSLEKLKWIEKYYPEINIKEYEEVDNAETVLSTTGAIENLFTNKIVNLFEFSSDNQYYWNESLLKFKNIYTEKRKCFIVATGPSLRIEDLLTLKANDIFCFGVNSILKIAKEWVADAYVATDLGFISNNAKCIEDYGCKYKFILDSCQEYWEKEQNDSYMVHIVTAGAETTDFSEEICQKIYAGYARGGAVTYACLQLAVYMGFTEIYLIGVDCNYVTGSKNNHFIVDEAADNMNHGEDWMVKGYEYAKEYADGHGIKVYNATRGGMLEVFERVDFDSLFGDKAK